MSLLSQALTALNGRNRSTSNVALGPIWGAVSTPTSVQLTSDERGSRCISFEEIYRSQPAVSATVNKIARQVSRLPLRAYEGDRFGEHEPLPPEHPLQRLLQHPTDRRGQMYLKQALVLPLLIHGNSVVAKYRGDGPNQPPTELLKLDWPFLSAYANQGGPIDFWGSRQVSSQERFISAQEVIHIGWQAPSGELGVSPLEQLGTTVALEDATRRYQAASFRNGVRPSGALVLPKEARTDAKERAEMRRDMERMHSGVDNSFRLALLTGGAEFKPMSFNATEAALIETRTVNRDEACMVYDLTPPLIGDFSRATYSNVEEANRALFKIHLPPTTGLIEDVLDAQLVQPEPSWDGAFVAFDFSQVLKGDPLVEAQAQGLLTEKGLITKDEGRRRLNLPARGGAADELTVQMQNVPIDQAASEDTPAK